MCRRAQSTPDSPTRNQVHGSVLGWFISAVRPTDVAGKDILEVGSWNANGTIRPMIEIHSPRTYLGVDIQTGPGVDAQVDCHHLTETLGSDCADMVIATEMLEHARDWQTCIREMIAALRSGGILLWTTRGPGFEYHEPPDYWRYTQAALHEVLLRAGLEPQVVCADPEKRGVFVRARKPERWTGWINTDLDDIDGITPTKEPLKIMGLPFHADGCGYYRFWQPYKQLYENSGHTIHIPPAEKAPYIPSFPEVEAMDLVAQQRPAGDWWLKEWRQWKGRTKLVYETDDYVMRVDTNLAHWQADEKVRTTTECVQLADLVTVSTSTLADNLSHYNENVVVIPNFIHEDLLKIERPHRDQITINWAGGSTHLQDLAMIQQPLMAALDTTGADIHFLGEDFRPLFGHRGRFTPFYQDLWEYYQRIDGDLTVVPLRSTPFNDSRSYIKCLEMAGLGIPVVASNVPPYRDFVVDGVTGYLVTTEAQWLRRITDLASDPDMRAEMGAKAKALAQTYTIQENWHHWVRAYEGVING